MAVSIVITRDDGGVSVAHNVPQDEVESVVAKWKEGKPNEFTGGYVSHQIVADPSALPEELRPGASADHRTFRNAWKADLSCDMGKARNIWKDKMRAARAPKLAALDVEYIRAQEAGNVPEQARIVAAKQALRDVTDHPAIEAAGTAEALKAVWPEILNGRQQPDRISRKSVP